MGESLFRQFSAIPDTELEKKVGLVEQLTQAYTGAAQLGTGDEAVGALYRIGLIFQSVAGVALEKTPDPAPGLTAEQELPARSRRRSSSSWIRVLAQAAGRSGLHHLSAQEPRPSSDHALRNWLPAEGPGSREAAARRASAHPDSLDTSKVNEARGPAREDSRRRSSALCWGWARPTSSAGDAHPCARLGPVSPGCSRSPTPAPGPSPISGWPSGGSASFAGRQRGLPQGAGRSIPPSRQGPARANLGSMLCGEGDVDGAKRGSLQVMKQAPGGGLRRRAGATPGACDSLASHLAYPPRSRSRGPDAPRDSNERPLGLRCSGPGEAVRPARHGGAGCPSCPLSCACACPAKSTLNGSMEDLTSLDFVLPGLSSSSSRAARWCSSTQTFPTAAATSPSS